MEEYVKIYSNNTLSFYPHFGDIQPPYALEGSEEFFEYFFRVQRIQFQKNPLKLQIRNTIFVIYM